jgi:hypothetical protein
VLFSLLMDDSAGAFQIKWDPFDAMHLASSHAGEVRIWDMRVKATYAKSGFFKIILLEIWICYAYFSSFCPDLWSRLESYG